MLAVAWILSLLFRKVSWFISFITNSQSAIVDSTCYFCDFVGRKLNYMSLQGILKVSSGYSDTHIFKEHLIKNMWHYHARSRLRTSHYMWNPSVSIPVSVIYFVEKGEEYDFCKPKFEPGWGAKVRENSRYRLSCLSHSHKAIPSLLFTSKYSELKVLDYLPATVNILHFVNCIPVKNHLGASRYDVCIRSGKGVLEKQIY